MTRVLVITSILPIATIEYKKTENDILLVTEDEIKKRHPKVQFSYLFTFPYAGKLLAMMSSKWKSYYELKKRDKYLLRNRIIWLFPILILPKKVFFRTILIQISLFMNKSKIKTILNEFKPTVIHAQNSDGAAYMARIIGEKYNIPYIVTLRGLNKFTDKIIKNNLDKASSLLAISPKQKIDGKKLTLKKINFIPHGINEEFFLGKKKNEIPVSPLRLVTVCRLIPLKNINLILKTLSNYEQEVIFDIYGEGPEKETLNKLIIELGLQDTVNLKGFIPNTTLPLVLNNYQIFIMPSFPETLGRVYFEAMACGLPVIASRNTGIDGLITEGKEGFLIDPNNNEDFSRQLIKILKKLQNNTTVIETMSSHVKKYALQYTWNTIVSKYMSVYNK